DSNLYGAFPVKRLFWVVLTVFCSERERPFSSRRLQSGSRSARRGSRDRNASKAWRLCRLARLVFRSALTPEHAEGRWTGDGPFFEAPVSDGVCLSDDSRGACHWGAFSRRTLVYGRFVRILGAVRSGVGIKGVVVSGW